MKLPVPESGLVIRYSYLWHAEHLEGREEGRKSRPAAIILTTRKKADNFVVTVLPITHTSPVQPEQAFEIPPITKQRLGLDGERSWIIVSEANRFVWPGPDLRPQPGKDMSTVVYGILPPKFFYALLKKYLSALRANRTGIVNRTE